MMTKDKERDDAMIAEAAEMFPPDTVDVQSRYVIVHQLRASADIQDAQTKRETGWADTSDRACLMRKAADALDALLAKLQPAPKPDHAEEKSVDTSFQGNRSPTHRCKVCGALWILYSDAWSLCSKECGKCCNNVLMGEQIEPLLHSDLVTWMELPSNMPEPDRAEVLFDELYGKTKDEQIDCFCRHFAELRAEWEAERLEIPPHKHYSTPLIERLNGPHEWGYRDPVEGGFIADMSPFEASDRLSELEAERPAVVVPREEQIKQMVTRFLGWKLPDDFHPDDGISFEPFFNIEWNAKQGKPPQRRTLVQVAVVTTYSGRCRVKGDCGCGVLRLAPPKAGIGFRSYLTYRTTQEPTGRSGVTEI